MLEPTWIPSKATAAPNNIGCSVLSLHIASAFAIWSVALAAPDLRHRRLPNALTLGGAVAALALRTVAAGAEGLMDGLEGGAICAALLLLPFLLHAAGGGDVKMLFAVGCFFGSARAVGALFWISVSGLALALAFLAFVPKAKRRALPFGVAISAGSLLELLFPGVAA